MSASGRVLARVHGAGKTLSIKSGEIFLNSFEGGDEEVFVLELLVVPGVLEGREDFFGEVEASPGPPSAREGILARHAGGEVLEVADGISDEEVILPVPKIPGEGLEGHGLGDDHGGFI